VTVSVTKKLAEQGRFGKDDVVVIAITGNGLKTQEAVMGRVGHTIPIEPNLNSLEAALKTEKLLATSS
ncbi:MAG TPA: threonine synthase, partial [Chthonomonas sp.]|nr:threonine synthase [Chthonomonas sp.]